MAQPSEIARRALEHHRCGEWDRAIALYRQVLKSQPNNAGVRRNLGQALLAARELRAAKGEFRQALAIDPNDLPAMTGLSKSLVELGELSEAESVWRDAAARWPERADIHAELARVLLAIRKIDQAVSAWRTVAELAPNDPAPLAEAARLLLRAGQRDAAKLMIDRALALDANHGDANVLAARLERRAGAMERALDRLKQAIAQGHSTSAGRASLEMAAILEDAGDFQAAFAAATHGKAMLRSGMPPATLDPSPALEVIRQHRLHVTREVVEKWKSVPDDGRADPTFIVGFPRSGTTLIEQMLWKHPAFVVTDELPLLHAVKEATSDKLRLRQPYPQSLSVLSERQIQTLRSVYFDGARQWLGEDAISRRIIDKSPLNTVDLPLVQRVFPKAKVIVALRDPRDTVLSCYFQAFTAGLPGLFDLESAAELYAAIMQLWMHYRELLDLSVMEVRYEDLVDDFEGQTRAVLNFLGVSPANDMSAQATAGKRFISTPSYEDVTRPVYRSSVARWRNHLEHLQSVRGTLEPLVNALGYPPWPDVVPTQRA